MKILTEPVGSIPRPAYLLEGMQALAQQKIDADEFAELSEQALKDTIKRFEATGSPVGPV